MAILYNTDFVVAIGFVIFVGILLYYRVPALIGAKLDERAMKIRADLDEARRLREEAQAILASYERKQKAIRGEAEAIIEQARRNAEAAAEAARADLDRAIARRLRTAEDQIAAAEAAALREIRDRAVAVAVAAAADAIRDGLKPKQAEALIDKAIAEVGKRLH